jgi:hypothetical protein
MQLLEDESSDAVRCLIPHIFGRPSHELIFDGPDSREHPVGDPSNTSEPPHVGDTGLIRTESVDVKLANDKCRRLSVGRGHMVLASLRNVFYDRE